MNNSLLRTKERQLLKIKPRVCKIVDPEVATLQHLKKEKEAKAEDKERKREKSYITSTCIYV